MVIPARLLERTSAVEMYIVAAASGRAGPECKSVTGVADR
jgi:hypothetical protein